jgi:hypothetical protein
MVGGLSVRASERRPQQQQQQQQWVQQGRDGRDEALHIDCCDFARAGADARSIHLASLSDVVVVLISATKHCILYCGTAYSSITCGR